MIEISATAESVTQAKELINLPGLTTIYLGTEQFSLRMPHPFSKKEIAEITELAHKNDKKVTVAINGVFHNDRIKIIVPFLQALEEINVDALIVGDVGVIHLIHKNNIQIPYIYDGHTLVTSAKQINFWEKRGAVGAILARELTSQELEQIATQISVPAEILVYGPTCIHHSKRPLLTNYFSYVEKDDQTDKQRGLFISEPKNTETRYSIFEDDYGTHIFANNDISLMPELKKLTDMGYDHWKLDGLFTKADDFLAIVQLFTKAKEAIELNQCDENVLEELNQTLTQIHPKERGLDTGFYVKDPNDVK